MRRALRVAVGLALSLCAVPPAGAQLPGRIEAGLPAQSASQASTPLESTFQERLVSPGRLRATGALEASLEGLPVFLRDANLTLKPRTYYFDESDPNGETKEAWALGGSLEYKSGLAWDRVWVGAELFGSWPLVTGPNAGETLLLTSTGSSYTVVGQAYLAANLSKSAQLIAGRTAAVDTPYANREFNRMTPNTFQGALVNGRVADEQQAHSLHYLVGYLDKIKERNSADFIPMSRAAGSDLSRGTVLAGGRYSHQAFAVGLIEYYTPDVLNILYAGANYTPSLPAPYELKLSAQFTEERPLAESGSTLRANQWGVEAVGGRNAAVLTLSFTQTSRNGEISSPWGSAPSFTRMALHSDARAGENALLGSLSYGIERGGLAGLSVTTVGAYYWNAVSTPAAPQPNQTELDLYLDYKVPKGSLEGLWFRLQRNWEWDAGGGQTNQWRAVVYWEVPLI